MTNETMKGRHNTIDGVSRRKLLQTGAVGVGAFTAGTAPAIAHDDDDEDDDNGCEENDDEEEVDEPDGVEINVLAEPAPFPDEVAARFCLEYADEHEGDPIVVDMDDASTVIVGEAIWEENSRSGWHRHPGPSIVNMVEGEIEYLREDDCVPRTYTAGDVWVDTGHVHRADSEGGARGYFMFLGVPEGEPVTEYVPPVEC
jgi:quercetin dioxygenase-like cupin family protein